MVLSLMAWRPTTRADRGSARTWRGDSHDAKFSGKVNDQVPPAIYRTPTTRPDDDRGFPLFDNRWTGNGVIRLERIAVKHLSWEKRPGFWKIDVPHSFQGSLLVAARLR